ncbi:MAG: FAD-dependent oxidoreductase [Roseiarcus sp.]
MGAGHIDADVVVVGGGPGGAAAAIACATRGKRVVLIERDLFARERPGETLHPGVEPLLRQLGIAAKLHDVIGARHDGIWIEWGGPPRFAPFGSDDSGPWSGFQVWRADFDALLLTRARELGVDVRQPATARGLVQSGGVMTDFGTVSSRMLVDASGRSRWLGRLLGVSSPARSPRLHARYGYAEGTCPSRDTAPALVGNASGWTWTARVRPGTYQWTRVCFDAPPEGEWVPEEFRGLLATARPRGADVTWRMATETARPGWFMVGDSAAMLDPTSSHGVLKALMSGMMAGHLIAAVLDGMAPAEEAAEAYHDWIAGWFRTDAERLASFYRDLGIAGFAQEPRIWA